MKLKQSLNELIAEQATYSFGNMNLSGRLFLQNSQLKVNS